MPGAVDPLSSNPREVAMSRRIASVLFAAALGLLVAGCGGSRRTTANVSPAPARPVSILVEVYDPVTNFVWENVLVRVVEASHEWSGCTCVSPYADYYPTDATGRVLLDEYVLAFVEVGFLEDRTGAAVLGSRAFEDDATVLLEISAPGFVPVYVDVPLSWSVPDVFVEVPFY
jgi:hypothetical protein